MGEVAHDGLAIPGRAVLAHEPAFNLGNVKIHPSTRQVTIGTEQQTIEPRVMQVLVVLANARGEVVSREALIDRCWAGRIVGDDSINHAIAKLRQLSLASQGAFAVETIPRVGYRLVENGKGGSKSAAAGASEDRHAGASRREVIGTGIAIGAIAAAGASVGLRAWAHEPPRLAKMYFQRGLDARGQGYATDYEASAGYFRQAVKIDPDYAEAWGALAWSYRCLVVESENPQQEARLRLAAQSAADRALDLQVDNADARLALLLLRPSYRRWAEVERGCRRLLAQHPEHDTTRFHLAFVMGETGRWREAIPLMQMVVNREPTWPLAGFRLFEELSNADRFDEADALIDEVTRLSPRHAHFWASKIHYLLLTDRGPEAVALAADVAERPIDDDPLVTQENIFLDGYIGGSVQARTFAAARMLENARGESREMLFRAAINCGMLGSLDAAFSVLEGYYFGRGPWGSRQEDWPPTYPLFSLAAAPLRRDPRFDTLIAAIGLNSFWHETRTQPDFRRVAAV